MNLFCVILSIFFISQGFTSNELQLPEQKSVVSRVENLNTDNQNSEQDSSNQTGKNTKAPSIEDETNYPDHALDNTSTFKKAFYKTLSILFAGIILVFLGIWLFKKLTGSKMYSGNNLRTIKILEKRPISPKSILYLIEVGGQKILISESQFEVRTISELEWLENTKQGL